jgi:hypothetical protein
MKGAAFSPAEAQPARDLICWLRRASPDERQALLLWSTDAGPARALFPQSFEAPTGRARVFAMYAADPDGP